MLSDMHIDFAQCLLERQFPNLKGLQLTLYQQKKDYGEAAAVMKDHHQSLTF